MHALPAYLAAIISSVSFGIASVAEQKGVTQSDSLDGLNFRSLLALRQKGWYLFGLALDGVGYLAFVLAVRALPLFFVQAVGAASILVTALAAQLWLQARLSKRDYGCIGVVLIGLTLVAFATGPDSTVTIASSTWRYLLVASGGVVIISTMAGIFAGSRPTLLAVLGGTCFSMVAVLTRILPSPQHWWQPLPGVTIALITLCGILGLGLFTTALQRGAVAIVYSMSFVTEVILPSILGLLLLGDQPLHQRWGVLLAGLCATLIGSSALVVGKKYLQHD